MPHFRLALIVITAMTLQSAAGFADDNSFKEQFVRPDPSKWYVSDGWSNGDWQSCEWKASNVKVGGENVRITLSDNAGKKLPITCGELRTTKRYSYGLYEARLRMAKGSGLNTAFFTYIGPPNGVAEWDEIDFEFLGKDTHSVSTNYYTNGKSQGGIVVPLAFDASEEFHNYAIDWEPAKIKWYVDGKLVHETPDHASLPSHPSAIFLSLWSGGHQEDNWLGAFNYVSPANADFNWVAYTSPYRPCNFPESMKCK